MCGLIGPVGRRRCGKARFGGFNEFGKGVDNQVEKKEGLSISSLYIGMQQCPPRMGAHLESTLAADGDKEGAFVPFGPFRCHGQVGAAHDADDDLTILDQAEADGVLAPAEKALGTIDRVERPVPPLRTAVRVTAIDQLEPFLLAPLDFFHLRPCRFLLREGQRFRHGFASEADYLRLDGGLFGFLEVGRVFLADDLVLRKVGEQQRRDESLRGVVADCGMSPDDERKSQ